MAKYNHNDKIVFHINGKDYNYFVHEAFLHCENSANNIIFKVLGMDDEETMTFCSKAFGYKAAPGLCPCCKFRDFDALSRLIDAIKEECEKHPKDTPLIHYDDKIIFSGGKKIPVYVKYRVMCRHLSAIEGDDDILFQVLGMDNHQSNLYCKKTYGYEPKNMSDTCWPMFKAYDYEALLRLFDKLIADYGLTITINDKPYKRSKIAEDTKKEEVIGDLEELKNKLLIDKVPSITKDLLYSNLSRITSATPVVFTLKDKTLRYTFNSTWLAIKRDETLYNNSILFQELGIKDIAQDLATACYGYEAGRGAWPDYRTNDKKALLRFLYVLYKEYDVKMISIDGSLLGDYVWHSLIGCDGKEEIQDTTTYVEHPYDLKKLETQATTLVDRSRLLNYRSSEISLTINNYSLKF